MDAQRIPAKLAKVGAFVDHFCDKWFPAFATMVVLFSLMLGLVIVSYVRYTEIDWVAYMEEVAGVVEDREFDYMYLKGGTGPLVYPAGFVYVYSVLYFLTEKGREIAAAQYIFALLQSIVISLVIYIYRKCYQDKSSAHRFPIWIIVLLPLSRRVMSLFVLRLFNDGVQMLVMYVAVTLFVNNRWSLGCLIYSLSVSIKMNALLFAPGVAVLLCQARGMGGAMLRILGICATSQIVIGLPFLLHAPKSYLMRAFELTRQFMYKWSVNGAFLSEDTFLDKRLALGLLFCHLTVLLVFGCYKWTSRADGGLIGLLQLSSVQKRTFSISPFFRRRNLNAAHIAGVLFSCNFIGIVFARTLHYQFYLWYFHSLPFLVCRGKLHMMTKALVLIAIEAVFNVYPPDGGAAAILSFAHFVILASLLQLERATVASIYEREGGYSSEERTGCN